jgi:glycosyltransferase involved in cell wall biosynthesis
VRALACTHVFPRFDDDPSAPFLLTWAQALAGVGASVSVVAPSDRGLPVRRDVGGVPVRFVRYGSIRLAYRGEMHQLVRGPVGAPAVLALVAAMARAFRSEVLRRRPDVVHVHWWLPGALIVRLARVAVPVVVTLHGTDVALVEGRPRLARLARWALAGAARVEAVSRDLAARLERATGIRVAAVNPMPLPRERLRPLGRVARNGSLHVLAVARLVPEKGLGDLIDAVGRLGPGPVLTIVGDGPERARLLARAGALGVRLDLRGACTPEQLRAAYAEADVVVQASRREGLGLVAAEAVAMGLPVVATDSGGARDVLRADQLVPVGDAAALAARIARAAPDPAAAVRVRAQLSPDAAAARTLEGWRAAVRCAR